MPKRNPNEMQTGSKPRSEEGYEKGGLDIVHAEHDLQRTIVAGVPLTNESLDVILKPITATSKCKCIIHNSKVDEQLATGQSRQTAGYA